MFIVNIIVNDSYLGTVYSYYISDRYGIHMACKRI